MQVAQEVPLQGTPRLRKKISSDLGGAPGTQYLSIAVGDNSLGEALFLIRDLPKVEPGFSFGSACRIYLNKGKSNSP